MIQLNTETIGDIHLLHMLKAENANTPLPTVIYFHGFNGEKESSLTPAYKMVEKGLRVILPDSKFHGERESNVKTRAKDLAIWEIVIQNITELEVIKDYFVSNGINHKDRIGVEETRMG